MAFDPLQAVRELITHPSVSTDPSMKKGMDGARDCLERIFHSMGLRVETIPTPLHPVILATRDGPPEWPHVVIYGHYDVQPADPWALWRSPPFVPTVRDGRLYGRGAADNKGPMMVHIAAAAQLLEERPDLPLRLTFLVEGEEEIGSPSFPGLLASRQDQLRGDFVLLSDTLSPSTDRIAITTGLRGIVCLNLRLRGPKTDLHSGIHGGVLLNPIQALAELCATLHHPDGTINIPGFYHGVAPVEEWERAEVAALHQDLESYRRFLGVPDFHCPPGYGPAEAVRFQPTLEFNGIGGGYQGEGTKTVIPSEAFVKISCRLVANQDPETIESQLISTLRERCPPKVEMILERGHSGHPYRVVPPGRSDTPADQNPRLAAAFRAAEAAVSRHFGARPLFLREGGSVPIISALKSVLGMDSVMIGMFTPEDNLHAPDESLHLGMFAKGIRVSREILERVAHD